MYVIGQVFARPVKFLNTSNQEKKMNLGTKYKVGDMRIFSYSFDRPAKSFLSLIWTRLPRRVSLEPATLCLTPRLLHSVVRSINKNNS